jgi:hypothetical protein
MNEEDAKAVLQEMFKDDEKVQLHMQKIRSIGKGYWVSEEAKKYILELTAE